MHDIRRRGSTGACALMFLILASCSADPSINWYRQAAGVRAVQEAVINGVETGVVSDDLLLKLDPILRTAEKYVIEAEESIDIDAEISRSKLAEAAKLVAKVARLYYLETGRSVEDGS